MFHREPAGRRVRGKAGRGAIALGLAASGWLAPAVVSGSPDWSAAELKHEIELTGDRVERLALSPEGKAVASTASGHLAVWELATGELLHRLDGHRSPEVERPLPVAGLAFSPDGTVLASTSWTPGVAPEASLKLWSLVSGERLQALAGEKGCREVSFSADGDSVWAACGRDVQRYVLDTGRIVERSAHFPAELEPSGDAEAAAAALPMPRQGDADALALSEDGTQLAWAGQPPTYPSPVIRLWQAHAGDAAGEVADDGESAAFRGQTLPEVAPSRDPVALSRDLYGLEAPSPITEERVAQRMLASGEVRVILTLSNLEDDAVRSWRYRLTFEPLEDGEWELVRVGRQQQCRRGPTEPDSWTTELCL